MNFDPLNSPHHPSHTGPGEKPPRQILPTIFAFPPNRETLGGTAYLIDRGKNGTGNILVDCPAWHPTQKAFIQATGGVDWLVITHRGGMGNTQAIQNDLGCKVLVQEQEAYLLPGMELITFEEGFTFEGDGLGRNDLEKGDRLLWTPGHTPGSSCLYYGGEGGVLFTGRHLLPNHTGDLVPLRTTKTFHWPRQIRSVQRLLDALSPETWHYCCPGANTGYLRGRGVVDRAYERVSSLDLTLCLQTKPGI